MSSITERHQYIISKVQQEGAVNVADLCKHFDVSSVTIRKDLKLLEDKQLLFRTHGGATVNNPYMTDRPVNEKEKLQSSEKQKIGYAAAQMIQPHDSIIIASGTTVLALSRAMQATEGLTVITSALNVAIELSRLVSVETIQLGGVVRKSSTSVVGQYSSSILSDFFCSKFYLGVDGIDLDFGLTTTNSMEAQLNRQMIAASQKTIVLADSTKFGKRGFGRICGLEDIDQVITDEGISEHMVKSLESMGVEVHIV